MSYIDKTLPTICRRAFLVKTELFFAYASKPGEEFVYISYASHNNKVFGEFLFIHFTDSKFIKDYTKKGLLQIYTTAPFYLII